MADDTPRFATDGNFDEVRVAGPVVRGIGVLFDIVMIAAGPALVIVLAIFGELNWIGVLGGIAIFCTAGWGGVTHLKSAKRARRRAARVERNGRPAVATVIASRDVSLGEQDGVEITLKITGPEVPSFHTTRRETTGQAHEVGDEFRVVVDPSDGVYRIL